MNMERLAHLITVLQNAADRERIFNMGHWGMLSDYNERNLCNTSACALGWAAFDQKFMAEGLCMVASWDDDEGEEKTMPLTTKEAWDAVKAADESYELTPTFLDSGSQKNEGFQAAMAFFDINSHTANYLFDPGAYVGSAQSITPERVIGHVQRLITQGELPDYDEPEADEPPADDTPPAVGFV